MEKKDVIISITGMQNYGNGYGENDTIELVTDGEYCFSEDGSTLTYMESELTGMEGTKTSFAVGISEIIMSREGNMNSQMVFEEGRKHFFLYDTPMGAATMGVDTYRIITRLGEHGGDMEIDYVIDFDSAVIGRNLFKINIREKKRDDTRWPI